MTFRESETVELKEIVVDDIKKQSLLLLPVALENFNLPIQKCRKGITQVEKIVWSIWNIHSKTYHE